jgi:hypothetical protein
MSNQFSQVLHRGNEEILDRLLPQSTPARPLEAVAVGGVCEGAFHQVLAPFAVSEPGHRVGLFFSCIQERLLPVATECEQSWSECKTLEAGKADKCLFL